MHQPRHTHRQGGEHQPAGMGMEAVDRQIRRDIGPDQDQRADPDDIETPGNRNADRDQDPDLGKAQNIPEQPDIEQKKRGDERKALDPGTLPAHKDDEVADPQLDLGRDRMDLLAERPQREGDRGKGKGRHGRPMPEELRQIGNLGGKSRHRDHRQKRPARLSDGADHRIEREQAEDGPGPGQEQPTEPEPGGQGQGAAGGGIGHEAPGDQDRRKTGQFRPQPARMQPRAHPRHQIGNRAPLGEQEHRHRPQNRNRPDHPKAQGGAKHHRRHRPAFKFEAVIIQKADGQKFQRQDPR